MNAISVQRADLDNLFSIDSPSSNSVLTRSMMPCRIMLTLALSLQFPSPSALLSPAVRLEAPVVFCHQLEYPDTIGPSGHARLRHRTEGRTMNRDEVMRQLLSTGAVAGKTASRGSPDFEAARALSFRQTGDEEYEATGPQGGVIRFGIWERPSALRKRRISCGRK